MPCAPHLHEPGMAERLLCTGTQLRTNTFKSQPVQRLLQLASPWARFEGTNAAVHAGPTLGNGAQACRGWCALGVDAR